VKVDDLIATVETDKVAYEFRSPVDGVLTKHYAKIGENVLVGGDMVDIDVGATGGNTTAATPKAETPAPKAEAPKAEAPKTESPKAAEAPKPAPKPEAPKAPVQVITSGSRNEKTIPMTRMRQRIAERLKASQNTAAMLTTFNEIDMSGYIAMREEFKDAFNEKHKVKLGFMSGFVKAAASALRFMPIVNSAIVGTDIIQREYIDISVAVATPTGLVVPVLRNADQLTFAGVEKTIAELGVKARDNKLTLPEMQGGTFTISNGGVYGSMMGTPIINPPQSAILGMHGTVKRAVVINDQIVIRPMMYIALTYDHRLIDGREAVLFLRHIKDCVEDPRRLLLEI